jgi:hypothetical protein
MKKLVIGTLTAALLAFTFTACSVVVQSDGHSQIAPATSAAYKFFSPTTERELESANTLREVNKGYVIVKASKDFDANLFKTYGAVINGSFTLDNGYSYYRLHKSTAQRRRRRQVCAGTE